jgi:hypothetical protein
MGQTGNDKIDEISLRDIILKVRELKWYLLSKWKIILLAGLVGGVLGLSYSLIKKPVYKAELSFALQDDNSNTGGLGAAAGLASQFGLDLGSGAGGAFSGDNLMELMKSRSIVESTLLTSVDINGQKQTLAELYISFNKFRDQWNEIPVLKDIKYLPDADRTKFTLKQDSILGAFYRTITKSNLTVEKKDKKLSIINVSVESKNELFSKYFAEILVKTVSDFYIQTKTKKSSQNVNILQRQADSVRHELNSAITGVASSSDVNPNPNPSLQIIRVPSQRKQVDVQANIAILTELVRNLEISKVSLRKETPLIQVIDRPILPLDKSKIGKLMGIVVGGFIGAFLISALLLLRKILKSIISE